jgi:hypothetical protein
MPIKFPGMFRAMFRAHFGTNDSFYEPFETYALNNDSFVLRPWREMVAKYRPERSGRIVFLTGSSIIRCDSSGAFVGMEIDMAKDVAKALGI